MRTTRYYIHTKDMIKARKTLKETTQLFSKNTELRIKRATNLLEIETNYYIKTGEFDKALDVFQQAFESLVKMDLSPLHYIAHVGPSILLKRTIRKQLRVMKSF